MQHRILPDPTLETAVVAQIDPSAIASSLPLRGKELAINEKYQHCLVSIIDRCLDAFVASDNDLGHTNIKEQRVDTGGTLPIKEGARSIAFHRKQFVEEEFRTYKNVGIVTADAGR